MQVLTTEEMRKNVPAIWGTPWEGLSNRYAYVPTYRVLDLLKKEGFVPTRASQAGASEYAKHMVRMRHVDLLQPKEDGLGMLTPEIVLVNSHDGQNSFQVMSGLFRLVCLNGMVVNAGLNQNTRIRHFGTAEEVVDAVYSIVRQTPEIINNAQEMATIELTEYEQNSYAKAAKELRWNDEEQYVDPKALLKINRPEDRKNDLWTTFSRVQENMLKGGVPVLKIQDPFNPTSKTTKRKSRGIKSVQEDIRLNKALWTLTEALKEYKLAA